MQLIISRRGNRKLNVKPRPSVFIFQSKIAHFRTYRWIYSICRVRAFDFRTEQIRPDVRRDHISPLNRIYSVYLFGEYVVSVHGHGRAVRDKVRDRLHYVPRIFPPSEPGQYAELHGHEAQTDPSESRRLSVCYQVDGLSLLKTKIKPPLLAERKTTQ